MKILVGSENPVKINATKEAFSRFFSDVEIVPLKVDSGVSHQPLNEETFLGARNRALMLKKMNDDQGIGADFFVGQEGGALQIFSKWFAAGVMCIIDKNGREGYGSTGYFELPDSVSQQLLKGKELGLVIDELTGGHNMKQKGGAISFLTGGKITRTRYYEHGLIVALIPFLNEKLYF
ncbi:MAG: inosine/xanthosine triphosphatase [Candidatus Aenigmatarchaeota archaeon]